MNSLSNRVVMPLIALVLTLALPAAGGAQTASELQRERPSRPELRLDRSAITDIRVSRAPDVVGKPLADARAILERMGLRSGREGFQSTREARPGTVVRQEPAAGAAVKRGEPIHLWTAVPSSRDDVGQPTTDGPRVDPPPARPTPDRPRLAVVPELIGSPASEAPARLERSRLRLGAQRPEESNVPAGTVMRQTPGPGARVLMGSRVDVIVAVPIRVIVPDLIGASQSEVPGRLRQARLRMGSGRREESLELAGTVVRQSPEPGTRVTLGTPVDVVIAATILVTVPDLRGAPESDVPGRLGGARLVLGDRRFQESEARRGTVVSQSPEPRSRVPLGTPVSIVVADPILVSVPELTGQFPADARRLLAERRLLLGRQREEESRVRAGLIVTQSRPVGARVPPGTTVDVAVAIALAPAGPPAPSAPPIVFDPQRVTDGPGRGGGRPPASQPPAPQPSRVNDGPRRGDDRPTPSEPSSPPPPVPVAMPAPPSMPSVPTPLPVSPPSPPPWRDAVWWGLSSMLVFAAVGSTLYHFRPQRPPGRPRTKPSASSAAPTIGFASRWDAGSVQLGPTGSLVAGPGLHLVSGIESDPPRLDREHLVTTAAHDGGHDDNHR